MIYGFKDPNHQVVDDSHIAPFGECPVEVKASENITTYVDGVIDSSRYYVLRIKDPKSSRTTSIGVGFRERDQAFDFKNCLNEYVRFVDRMHLAEKLASQPTSTTTTEEDSDQPVSNFSFFYCACEYSKKRKVR